MEKSINIGSKREFLNEDFLTSLTAMIGYQVKVVSWNRELVKEGLYDGAEIDFAVTSCHKKLNLDFDICSKDDMRNSLYKLDKIIEVCESMKDDLKKARLIVNKGIKRAKELREEEERKLAERRRPLR